MVKRPRIPAGAFTIKGKMMFIGLSRGRVAVADRTYVSLLAQHRWHAKVDKRKRRVYARTQAGGVWILLHRLIYASRPTGVIDMVNGYLVDHWNLDGLDCRQVNLRRASIDENNRNRPANRNCRSGCRGVWQAKNGTWRASIQHAGKRFSLGTFSTKKEAARAYSAAALEYHREFAHAP